MDRALTGNEESVVRWLLDSAAMVDVSAFRQGVDELRVVAQCACGCCSLDFTTGKKDARIIADALAVYPDGQQAGLILWGRGSEILWLEIYDLHPGTSHRFPEMSNLRTWEVHGQQGA